MTLAEQTIQRIDSLGVDQAATLSGLSVNQIKTIKRTGNVTLKAYEQLVLATPGPPPNEPTVINATFSATNEDVMKHDLERRVQILERDMEEVKAMLVTKVVSQVAAGQPIGPLHQPPRPINAPPVIQGKTSGHGSFDPQGIAPSAADANSEGGQGPLAGPAEHMHLPTDGRTQDWAYSAQDIKAIREGRMTRK